MCGITLKKPSRKRRRNRRNLYLSPIAENATYHESWPSIAETQTASFEHHNLIDPTPVSDIPVMAVKVVTPKYPSSKKQPKKASLSPSITQQYSYRIRNSYETDIESTLPQSFNDGNMTEINKLCVKKLGKAIGKVNRDNISKKQILKTLSYAIKVLDGTMRDDGQEDSLMSGSEFMPHMARVWLRPGSPNWRADECQNQSETMRFMMRPEVEGMSMCSSHVVHRPLKITCLLKKIDSWEFNIFRINDVSDQHSLKYVGYELLHRYDLIRKFQIPGPFLENFLSIMENGYSMKNPYHNLVHAADVAQTCNVILRSTNLYEWLDNLETFALFFSAIIHDYKHPGQTNKYMCDTNDFRALLYNDRSVLENFHLSSVFRELQNHEEMNILCNLSKAEFRKFRTMVIDMVFATDMAGHIRLNKNMQKWCKKSNEAFEKLDNHKSHPIGFLLHCADISHPAKEWDLHQRWVSNIFAEFFKQGDNEKKRGLTASFLCDRETTNIPKSQANFIEYIVSPVMDTLSSLIDRIMELHNKSAKSRRARNEAHSNSAIVSSRFDDSYALSQFSAMNLSSMSLSDSVEQNLSPVQTTRVWEKNLKANLQKWKDEIERAEYTYD